MTYTEREARERLKKSIRSVSHPPYCEEKDYHFINNDIEERPNRDGIVTIKCWNCDVQDHFLYVNEGEK